jgi:hypothetical protein
MKIACIIIAFAMIACSTHPPADLPRQARPAARPVPEREVLALVRDLVSVAGRRGFSMTALIRALDAENSVDVCRALALAPAPCEELGARVHAMGLRLEAADGEVIGDASTPPRGCSDEYRPCYQVAITRAALTGRFAAIIAGQAVYGVLQCHCRHCPRGRLGPVCDVLPGA